MLVWVLGFAALVGARSWIVRTQTRRLSGTVSISRSTAIIRGAEVVLRPLQPDAGVELRTVTDRRGRYELGPVPDGTWSLFVVADGFSEFVASPFVTTGSPQRPVANLELTPATTELRLRVVGAETGAPVVGAAVRLTGLTLRTVTTNEDGDAQLQGLLANGHEIVEVHPVDWVPVARFQVTPTRAGVIHRVIELPEFTPPERVLIEQEIYEERRRRTSASLRRFHFESRPIDEPNALPQLCFDVETDADGGFALELPTASWNDPNWQLRWASHGGPGGGVPETLHLWAEAQEPQCAVSAPDGGPALSATTAWVWNDDDQLERRVDPDGRTRMPPRGGQNAMSALFAALSHPSPIRQARVEASTLSASGSASWSEGADAGCSLKLVEHPLETFVAPLGAQLAWVRVPSGRTRHSQTFWFAGSAQVPVHPKATWVEFGAFPGTAQVRLEPAMRGHPIAPPAGAFKSY